MATSELVRKMSQITSPRRRFRQVLLLSLFLIAGHCIGVNAAGAPQSGPPNIILIISDDQAWTDYGFMGHPSIQTPNLDAIASQGVLFRRGYVPTALCRPSLMTLATGRYAHQHGVTGNDPSSKQVRRDSEHYRELQARVNASVTHFDTLPGLLAERGYTSFQSGKWWEGSYSNGDFSSGMTRGFPQPGGRHGDDGLSIGREGLGPIKQFIDEAVDADKPFFLWYAPYLPHFPHDPPPRLLQNYLDKDLAPTVARYYAMCEWLDETVGQLMSHLESRGIREDTLVVFVADNGWIQSPEHAGFAPRSKLTPYEGGVRSPILFSWPAILQPSDRPELASSIDLLPTILAAAGARIPSDLPGLNLLPDLLSGARIDRQAIFGEGFAHDIADIDNPQASLLSRWCIEGRWKLILSYDGEQHRFRIEQPTQENRSQLYDLVEDPHERENLAKRYPEIVARLSARIRDWYPLQDSTD